MVVQHLHHTKRHSEGMKPKHRGKDILEVCKMVDKMLFSWILWCRCICLICTLLYLSLIHIYFWINFFFFSLNMGSQNSTRFRTSNPGNNDSGNRNCYHNNREVKLKFREFINLPQVTGHAGFKSDLCVEKPENEGPQATHMGQQ